MNVPSKALATAKPAQKLPGSRWKTLRMDSVTPEITTVSKPNSSPARLAVTMTPRFPGGRFMSPDISAPVAHIEESEPINERRFSYSTASITGVESCWSGPARGFVAPLTILLALPFDHRCRPGAGRDDHSGPYNVTILEGGEGLTRKLEPGTASLDADGAWSMTGWVNREAHTTGRRRVARGRQITV